jgi:hypothetical protein
MMKIVPASRRVTEASLAPSGAPPEKLASIARSRATTPVGGGVAD